MTTTAGALIPSKAVEAVETVQYTSSNVRSIIDNFDVYNGTTDAIPYTVRLVPSGSTADASNTLYSRAIAPGETARGVLVGQILEPGDFISTLAGETGLVHRASGRKVTT